MKYKIMEYDDVLKLYEADLDLRVNDYHKKREELIGANGSIVDFANGHEYFGIHRTSEGWVYREPKATTWSSSIRPDVWRWTNR